MALKTKAIRFTWAISMILVPVVVHNIQIASAQPAKEEVGDPRGFFLLAPEATFAHYCAPCHGPAGRGDGRYFSSDLSPLPRDLTDVAYMKTRGDGDVLKSISEGSVAHGKSNLCPGWGKTLTQEQMTDIARYVRSLASVPIIREETKAPESRQDAMREQRRISLWFRMALVFLATAGLLIAAWVKWRRSLSGLSWKRKNSR